MMVARETSAGAIPVMAQRMARPATQRAVPMAKAWKGVSVPAGMGRRAVRGMAASREISIHWFRALAPAAERFR